MSIGQVPCGDCVACCRGKIVILHPDKGDRVGAYRTVPVTVEGKPHTALQRKQNGDCIYLGDRGCSIHRRVPFVCKTFDCRVTWHFLSQDTTREQRRAMVKQRILNPDIAKAGRQRMHTLAASPMDLDIFRARLEELI